MRLGVNARRLSGQRLGIGRYIEYMVKYWDEMLTPSERVTLYVQEPLPDDGLKLSDAFSVRQLRPRLTGALWENMLLPRRSADLDVLFGPSYTMPLAYRGRSVVAIHSINEIQPGAHPWRYRLTYTPWYRASALKADRVIVPSQSTSADIQRHYGIAPEKIDVVAEGVDDSFVPLDDEELVHATRVRYLGVDRPYILFVGKSSQRRNIPNLMAAFSLLKKRDGIPHHLLLMGPNPLGLPLEEMASDLGITDSFVQTEGRLGSHQEIIAVYNAADLYAYPSTYDGFSLTVVEAMACGLPVVTVDRPAIQEIAGGCALMIDEPTVDALADGMYQVLSDPALGEDLRKKGLERAGTLRWRNTAQQTLDVLRGVAQA